MLSLIQRFSIRQRLIFVLGSICTVQLLATVIIFAQLKVAEGHLESVIDRDIKLASIVSAFAESQLQQEVYFEQMFRVFLQQGFSRTGSANDEIVSKFLSVDSRVETQLEGMQQILTGASDLGAISELLDEVVSTHDIWREHVEDVVVEVTSGTPEGAIHHAEHVGPATAELLTAIKNLRVHVAEAAELTVEGIRTEVKGIERNLIIAESVSVALALLIGISIILGISYSLTRAKRLIAALASGDMATEVKTSVKDEIGELLIQLENMRSQMAGMMGIIRASGREVADVIQSQSISAGGIRESANLQTNEIQQVAAAIHEMAIAVQEVARNSSHAHQATEEVVKIAMKGQSANNEASTITADLVSSLGETSSSLTELERNSKSISKVLDVIKGIAEQTNLLALNAAIEAARAGEQGRGFAVVADEVRTLAQRTQESTVEIEGMVSQFLSGSQAAVNSMKKSSELGQETIRYSAIAAEQIEKITESVRSINDMNMQIASAVEEQTSVADEVNGNITRVNAAATDILNEISATTNYGDNLMATASDMNQALLCFKLP